MAAEVLLSLGKLSCHPAGCPVRAGSPHHTEAPTAWLTFYCKTLS